MKNNYHFKKLAMASAIGSLLSVGATQAAETSFNLYEIVEGFARVADMPMAGFSAGDDGALDKTEVEGGFGGIPGGSPGVAASRQLPGTWTGTLPNYVGGLPATFFISMAPPM